MRYDRASAAALLVRTPTVLRAMLEGLPAVWLDAPEAPGAWSPREVACHMADLERDGWLPRVRTILEHGAGRPLPPIDRERFRERYAGRPIEVVLDDFRAMRASNLRALDALALDDAALAAVGLHPGFGEVRLSQLLSTWVVHDLTHLAQIDRALAAQYREEVGPWIGFLSILGARSAAASRSPGASDVRIEAVHPESPEALRCMERYYAELDRRFEGGFDPSVSEPAPAHDLLPPRGVFLVATSEGRTVGCGAVLSLSPTVGSIKRMWVAPDVRRLGVGRRMLAALEDHAARLGLTTLRLETHRSLREAIELYGSAGYREVEAFNDDPYAAHWFEKHLAGA